MNNKIDGHNHLVILQDMLVGAVIKPSPAWSDHHIASFTIMYKAAHKLLSIWNASVIATQSGFALVPGTRNRMIGQMTKIIMHIETLSQDIDAEGQILLTEIDVILEDLSAVILAMATLEDSA